MSARVPKYRHHPNGQAFVQVKGKRTYLGVVNSETSIQEYERIIQQIRRSATTQAEPIRTGSVDITLDELMATYLDFASGYYVKDGAPTSQFGRIKAAFRPMKDFGHLLATEFGPLTLKRVRSHSDQHKHERQGR